MAILAIWRLPPFGRWRCALPQTALITARTFPGLSRRSSPFHEPMAVGQGEATLGCFASNRMVAWQNGCHRRLRRPGWANYTFAFHDGDEVGPGLLAQIAKKTGLQPEDL